MKSLAVSIVLASAASSFAFLYTDTEFTEGSWFVESPQSGELIQHSPTGGNPGAYGHYNAYISGLPGTTRFYNPDFTYDPGVSGPLTNLRMGFDAKFISGANQEVTLRIGYGIRQGDNVYWNSVGNPPANWTRYERDLQASDFVRTFFNIPGNPDFSANGAPMQFMLIAWAIRDEFGLQTVGGWDNFMATNVVPEPATLLALAAGLGLLGRRKARR